MKLLARKAIITGASRGLGFAVAKAFLEQGASVTLCARQSQNLQLAATQLNTIYPRANIVCVTADISNPADVERLIETANEKMNGIDILVSNAGVLGTKGGVDTIDWEEWSTTIDINLKGSVLLCKYVLPYLKKKNYGKIILLSGGGATKPMPFLSAYAASKAAVVRFGETLAGEVKANHIDVNCLAPGALNTQFLEEILTAGPEKVGADYYEQALKQKADGGSPLSKSADLCVYLASAESDGITGKLISAIWDPWQSLSAYKEQLQNSDIYTLRRIIPTDRGESWG